MSGECQTKNTKNYDKEDDEKPIIALDEGSFVSSFPKFSTAPRKSVVLV